MDPFGLKYSRKTIGHYIPYSTRADRLDTKLWKSIFNVPLGWMILIQIQTLMQTAKGDGKISIYCYWVCFLSKTHIYSPHHNTKWHATNVSVTIVKWLWHELLWNGIAMPFIFPLSLSIRFVSCPFDLFYIGNYCIGKVRCMGCFWIGLIFYSISRLLQLNYQQKSYEISSTPR